MKKLSILTVVAGLFVVGLVRLELVAKEPADERSIAAEKSDAAVVARPAAVDRNASKPDESSVDVDRQAAEPDVRPVGVDRLAAEPDLAPAVGNARQASVGAPFLPPPTPAVRVVSETPVRAWREAVVDVSYVFKHYKGFQRDREQLKSAIHERDKELKQAIADMQALRSQLNALTGNSETTQAARKAIERVIDLQKATYEAKMKSNRRDFLKQEATTYQRTYVKLRAVIAAYAKEHGIRIVRRAKRLPEKGHEVDSEASDDPKAILETLNRDVLYLESDEIDITSEILKRMNAEERGGTRN